MRSSYAGSNPAAHISSSNYIGVDKGQSPLCEVHTQVRKFASFEQMPEIRNFGSPAAHIFISTILQLWHQKKSS